MQYYPYNSRNGLYRNHLGALTEGATLRLKLLLHNDAHVHGAFLKMRRDSEKSFRTVRMFPTDTLDSYRFYECEITPSEGLYWYGFYYTSDYGVFNVVKSEHSMGIVSKDEGGLWQLTVYSRDFKTPEWLKGGIIYQIFPDRFYRSGKKKANVPDDRFICTDWEKQPEYRQNAGKCSLGNDYYGGDFKGIEQKLPYLKSLGVSCIYLNPIFLAHSNHRYNTADYLKLDPMLGTEEDFCSLIKSAEKQGIYIILDGVFSHTGDDSVYFNRRKRYGDGGAFNSADSPFYSWYKFGSYEQGYACWWGVPSLPETDEEDLSFSNFITGENGVIRRWLKTGVRGWRLDVADELPDSFLDKIRLAVKADGDENYLLGEVWEDATNKISYGVRRRFLRGKQLDSVMNYPLGEAIISFITGGDAAKLCDTVEEILENYPLPAVNVLMNHIGTHDTARILTRLAKGNAPVGDREWQSKQVLTPDELAHGCKLLKLAALIQYTMPGVPSLYYGDEVGMAGYGDPFCRAGYPWGRENTELLEFYKKLGAFRRASDVFKNGGFTPIFADGSVIAYIRYDGKSAVLIAVNRSTDTCEIEIPKEFSSADIIFGNKPNKSILKLNCEDFAVLALKA